ncbi:hypothetical protein FSP39_019285 [Pinctada imbricata]|uniref:Uncharacterized protein n=1 Tax=Pinctada imbricata TaxID=66713 RepID=A0AA88Y8E1_PINIB|nr:hypothetical protein FSP39_019285 [Pinctada imbricata]
MNLIKVRLSVIALSCLLIGDGKNHAGCCKRRNVPDICLDYCMGQMPAVVTAEHDKCLNDVMDIIACYEDGQGYLPGPPTLVSAVQLPLNSMTAIQVMWVPPTDNLQMVTGYRVLYKLQSESTYTSSDILLVNQSASYVITNAQIEKTYMIYVISVGVNGASQPSPMYYLTVIPNCCIEKGVSEDCLEPLCGTNRMFNMDPTVLFRCYSDLNNSVQCLTGQRDHRPCCERVGIPQNCLTFCSGQVPDILGQDATQTWNYTSCIIRLSTIDACVQEGMWRRYPGSPPLVLMLQSNTVLYKERDSGNGQQKQLSVTGTSAEIMGLLAGTHYEVQVAASNDKGSSLPSTKIVFLTYACCIQKNVTSTCMTLCSYSYLSSPSGIDWALGYQCVDDLGKVIACAADERDHTDCCKRSGVPDSCLYFCRFKHSNNLTISDIGCVPYTPIIASCYREGIVSLPKSPQNLTIVRVTAHTVMLSWKQPDTTQVPVSSYEVLYTTDMTKKWMSSSTSVTTHIVNNLKPSTLYYVQVIAVNSNGTSLASPMIIFTTLDYDDSAPSVGCNYTVYKDTALIYDGIVSSSNTNTMEECRQVCEDSGLRFDQCVGFLYGRTAGGECTLYYDKNAFQKKKNKTGFDLYVKTCGQSPTINTTIDWTAIWHNRSDCCDKNNVSDTCLPACKSGDLTNPFICENDLNVLIACATDGKNHTDCCQRNRVPQPCLPFCAGKPMEKNAITSLCLSFAPIYINCFTKGKGQIPSPPTSFQIVSVSTDFVTLSWEKPVSNCDTNCSYKVMIIKKDGAEFQNATRDKMYKLRNLKPSTKYTLSVVAINTYGSSLPALTQDVITLPSSGIYRHRIKQSPSHPEVTGNVDLICEVYGPSQYVVSWYFNNKVIKKGRQLSMRSLVEEQEGTYICSATDFVNSFNKSFFLQLKYKPRVVNPTGDRQIVNSNKIGTLSCQFYGLPDKITWQKDGKNVKDLSDSFRSYATQKPILGTALIKSVLSIYYVTDKSVGDYTCIGENKFGNATGHMRLTSMYMYMGLVLKLYIIYSFLLHHSLVFLQIFQTSRVVLLPVKRCDSYIPRFYTHRHQTTYRLANYFVVRSCLIALSWCIVMFSVVKSQRIISPNFVMSGVCLSDWITGIKSTIDVNIFAKFTNMHMYLINVEEDVNRGCQIILFLCRPIFSSPRRS